MELLFKECPENIKMIDSHLKHFLCICLSSRSYKNNFFDGYINTAYINIIDDLHILMPKSRLAYK